MSDKKYCSNCCQNIESSKFFLHERMCSINVKKCPQCKKPFTVEDLEDHINEVHGETECEYCKKKYPNSDIEKHRNRCDCKMVPCCYCELQVLLGELKDHQKQCGAITEPCPVCNRYIQRKEMDDHILQGCPPPKNDRRSVDVIHNNKFSLDLNKNNNIYNNYNPINDYIPEELLFGGENGKFDIKIHNNYNKPDLHIRPASGKKILNENLKKSMSNLGNKPSNKENNIIINNTKETDIINNINTTNKNSVNANNKNSTNNKKSKIGKSIGTTKTNNNNDKNKYNNYMNKQNINKGPVTIKPVIINDNNKNDSNNSINNLNNNKKSGIKASKPSFASSLSKGNLNNSKKIKDKKSDEEFRKSREKFQFKNAKNLEGSLNKEVKNLPNLNKKGIINDDDYMANFNFGEVDDEQLMQQVIEQSLKDRVNKK